MCASDGDTTERLSIWQATYAVSITRVDAKRELSGRKKGFDGRSGTMVNSMKDSMKNSMKDLMKNLMTNLMKMFATLASPPNVVAASQSGNSLSLIRWRGS